MGVDGSGRVETLDLANNNLSGPISIELGSLASLRVLDLSGNNLSGPLPPELGSLAGLQWVSLAANNLPGPIPLELGNLTGMYELRLGGNPGICAPDGPVFRAWLVEKGAHWLFSCPPADVRLLPRALMRADGNGLSLALPDDLRDPTAVDVSDPGVVVATIADGWLKLLPWSIGRADVELVPSGDGLPAIAGVVVREPVGTFGIDIVMDQPAPLAYEEGMVEAADWWSFMLDGTEWPDREQCNTGSARALADELLIWTESDESIRPGRPAGTASPCLLRRPIRHNLCKLL